jgi:hypothetical protein
MLILLIFSGLFQWIARAPLRLGEAEWLSVSKSERRLHRLTVWVLSAGVYPIAGEFHSEYSVDWPPLTAYAELLQKIVLNRIRELFRWTAWTA